MFGLAGLENRIIRRNAYRRGLRAERLRLEEQLKSNPSNEMQQVIENKIRDIDRYLH